MLICKHIQLAIMYYISKKVVQTNLVLHTKASFTFFTTRFSQILCQQLVELVSKNFRVYSLLAPPTTWHQRRWKLFVFLLNSVLIQMILQLYFIVYSCRNKSKRHALCLFTKITIDTVPWQRGFYEKLRESCLLLSVEL